MRFTKAPRSTFRILAVNPLFAALPLGFAALTHARATARERAIERQSPPLGTIIKVNGRKVHALTKGTGPDLILLHGASGNLRDFLPQIDLLAPYFRVTAFDRPGLGYSDEISDGAHLKSQALHLSAAATTLGIRNPILVAHSYGASVAIAWALHAPLIPKSLVAISAPSMPWTGGLDIWYRLNTIPFTRALVVPLAAAFVPKSHIDSILADVFAPHPVPDFYHTQGGPYLAIRRTSLRCNADHVNALHANLFEMVPHYPTLTLPIDLIHGALDHIVPNAIHSAAFAPLLPNATLTVIPDAGHTPHHSHTALVLDAIHRAGLR